MNDSEISKALALAIGWKPWQIVDFEGQDYIGLPVMINGPRIKLFDYRFAIVIWPIALRYYAFPYPLHTKGKNNGLWNVWSYGKDHVADSAAKAVALAVIQMAKKVGKS